MFTRKKPVQNYYAYAALFTATVIWGTAGPVIKLTLQYLPVFTFLFLRFLIVCTATLPILIYEIKKNPIDSRDMPNLAILGLLSQTSLIIVFFGYKFTSAIDAAFIGITYPIMAIVAGYYFYKEKVTELEKLGFSTASIGALLIILGPLLSKVGSESFTNGTGTRLLGNSLILIYQVTWLMYILWSKNAMGQNSSKLVKATKFIRLKPMKKQYSPLIITLLTFYVGLVSFIPLVILESVGIFGGKTFADVYLGTTPILGLLYMSLLSSIVAYIFFQWGLSKAEVTDTGLFTYLTPIFALPAAYILLKEVPSPITLVGAVIIAIGVIIAEKYKS